MKASEPRRCYSGYFFEGFSGGIEVNYYKYVPGDSENTNEKNVNSLTHYVDCLNGDDTNDGSCMHPWKTTKHAMETVGKHDKMYVSNRPNPNEVEETLEHVKSHCTNALKELTKDLSYDSVAVARKQIEEAVKKLDKV